MSTATQQDFGLEIKPKEIVVKAGFDPSTCKELADIFENPVARAIWALIKRDHLTSQYFNDAVRTVARRIALNLPKDGEDLRVILLRSGDLTVNNPWPLPSDMPRYVSFGGPDPDAAYIVKKREERREKMQLLLECVTGVKVVILKYEP